MVLRRIVALFWTISVLLGTAQAVQASSSCAPSPQMNLADVRQRLARAERLWGKRGPINYSIEIKLSGARYRRSTQLRVNVGGARAGAEDASYVSVLSNDIDWNPPSGQGEESINRYTAKGLFAQVQTLLNRRSGRVACGWLSVTFDARDGHLRSLEYTPTFAPTERFVYRVSALLPYF